MRCRQISHSFRKYFFALFSPPYQPLPISTLPSALFLAATVKPAGQIPPNPPFMPTPTTIELELLNAIKSAGSFAPTGKIESSDKVLSSGLDSECQFVYGEDRADFIVLQREYFSRFQPHTPEERFHTDLLVRNEWTLRRLFRVECHLWEYHAMCSDRSSGVPLGEGFNRASEVFMRLQRRVAAAERSYKEALKDLNRMQAKRNSDASLADREAQLQPLPTELAPTELPQSLPTPIPALLAQPQPATPIDSQRTETPADTPGFDSPKTRTAPTPLKPASATTPSNDPRASQTKSQPSPSPVVEIPRRNNKK
jgi:hypothetical protein